MLETPFVKKLKEKLEQLPRSWWEKISQRSTGGTPDIIGCMKCDQCDDAKFIAFECKKEDGTISKLQDHVMYRIREAGGVVRVVRPSQVDELLESLRSKRER